VLSPWWVIGEVERGTEKSIANRRLSATSVAEPQTEAAAQMIAPADAGRDERAICAVKRRWSRGDWADRQPVEWSESGVGQDKYALLNST
jgi:hypothetical protein